MSFLDKLKAAKAAQEKQATPTPTPEPAAPKKLGINLGSSATTGERTVNTQPIASLGAKKKIGISLGAKTVTKPLATPAKPIQSPTPPKEPSNNFDAASPLGKLLNSSGDEGQADVEFLALSDEGKEAMMMSGNFDIELLQGDWPSVSDDGEDDIDERQEERNQIVAYAMRSMNKTFQDEMETLRTCIASHPVMTDISQITKLTLMRIKESPASMEVMDKYHASTICKSLRLMALKRQSAVKNAKSGAKEFSATLEKASTGMSGHYDDAALSEIGDFELGM